MQSGGGGLGGGGRAGQGAYKVSSAYYHVFLFFF